MAPTAPPDPTAPLDATPPDTTPPDTTPATRTWWDRTWRLALGVGCLLIVVMWAGIFLGLFDKTAPGTLSDKRFSQQAEPTCTATKQQLGALPKAFETTDHVDRAKVVAQTNIDLRAMIDQLKRIAPNADRDGRMTQEWLADWSTYVDNREDYATRLRDDETARFYESPKSSSTEQISKPIDRFAYVNKMPSCDTPADMA